MSLSKQNLNIAVGLTICFVLVLVIFTIFPLIPDPNECETNDCPAFISLRELATGEPFFSEELPINANEPAFCIEVFQPVCGIDGVTYTNQCFLDLAETEFDHQGNC